MSSKNIPKITVLMSVYNGLPYLEEALDSILTQTFTDFEFLIIDDASTDKSSEILNTYAKKDSRIRIITNEKNIGLGASLAKGMELAKGKWVARIDSDDVAESNRLQVQHDFANKNPHLDIIGSSAIDIDEAGNVLGKREVPTKHEEIVDIIWTCPIVHPSVFLKKESILKVGNYYNYRRRQDYNLWFRCVKHGLKFANISEPLLRYRFDDNYFIRNNFYAMLRQMIIGWQGNWLVNAPIKAYFGVAMPVLRTLLPKKMKRSFDCFLKYFDPRYKKKSNIYAKT